MCFTMGRILTIGTFMEQISDVYRYHRHQRISSVAAPRGNSKLSVPDVSFINSFFTKSVENEYAGCAE